MLPRARQRFAVLAAPRNCGAPVWYAAPVKIEVVDHEPRDEAPAIDAAEEAVDALTAEDETEDRLFSFVAIGLMVLLLLCVVLILIADRRTPAGL